MVVPGPGGAMGERDVRGLPRRRAEDVEGCRRRASAVLVVYRAQQRVGEMELQGAPREVGGNMAEMVQEGELRNKMSPAGGYQAMRLCIHSYLWKLNMMILWAVAHRRAAGTHRRAATRWLKHSELNLWHQTLSSPTTMKIHSRKQECLTERRKIDQI